MSELFGNEQAVETTGKVADKFGNLSDKLEQVKTVSGALEILYNKKINKTFENFTKVLGNGEETLGKLVKQQNSAVKTLNKLNTATGEFNKEVAKSETVFAKLFKTLNPVVKTLEKLAIGGLVVKGITAITDGLIKVTKELNNAGAALSILEKSGFDLSEIYGLQQFNDDIANLNTGGIEEFATTAVSKFTQISSLLAQIGTLIPEQLAQGLKKGEDVLGDYFDKYQELVGTTLKNTVTSTDALKASYTALQAGFNGAQVDNVVNSSLKLLVAQGGDAEQIVALLKQTMTAFNLEANKSGDILGKLNKVVDLGITTIPELQYGFGALGVSANTAGVSFDEMAGSLVQLTKAGSTTSTAMTKLNNLYNQITSGQITERLKDLGATYIENGKTITATFDSQTIATKGFAKAAEDVYASLGKSNEKLRSILPDSEAFAGFTGVLTEGADGLEAVIKQITNSGVKELEKAFKIRIDNDKVVQFSQVVNRASESVLKLGKVLAPVFDKGLDYVDAMVDKLSYLVENYGGLIKVAVGVSVAFNGVAGAAKALLGTVVVLAGALLQWQLLTGKLIGNILELGKAITNGGSATNKYNLLWNENASVTKKVLGTIGQLLGVYDLQKSKVESLTEAERTKIREVAGGTSKLISNAKEEIATRDTQIQKLEDQILAHRKRVAEIEKEIQANNRLTDSEQQSIKQRKDLLKEAIASAKAEIKLREEKIQQIEKEIAANKDLTDSQKTANTQNKETLQQRVADKKKELAKLEDEDNKLVTKQPLTAKEKQQKQNLIAQINTEADNKVTTLRNVKSNNLSAKDKLKELTERLKTEDPMNLLEDVLARDVNLNKPQNLKVSGRGSGKLADIQQGIGRTVGNVNEQLGKVGGKIGEVSSKVSTKLDSFGFVGKSLNNIAGGAVNATKGLGGFLAMGVKVGSSLAALVAPTLIVGTLVAAVVKLAASFLDADKAAERFAEKLNGDSDSVTTLGEQYKELGSYLASKLPQQFDKATESANFFVQKLKEAKDAIGEILNGSGRKFNQVVPELDRAIGDSQSYNDIEGKALQRNIERLKKGLFRDVFVGEKDDQKANLSDFLGTLNRNNVSRTDSTKLADIVDKQRADIFKQKNASQEQADNLLKKADTARELLRAEGVTDEEITALKTTQELNFFKSNKTNSDIINRYEKTGRDKTKLNEEESSVIGKYEDLVSRDKDNESINRGLAKKTEENGKLEVYINRVNQLEQEAKTFTETSDAFKKAGEDTVAILDSINTYIKNLSDAEGTTNPYLSGLKRNIDNTLQNTQKDVALFEKTYDKFVNVVKQKGEQAAKELLTEEELQVIKNSQARFAKNAETLVADITAAVEAQGITAEEAAKKIQQFVKSTDAGMLDKTTRQQLIQQERALLNAQYENNVNYLEQVRTLYQQYGEKELVYNEDKFRKLQQLELQQLDEKIKQANLNYGAVKDDKEISKEEKNKRKIEVDILVDQKQLRQLEQAIELLQKQNDIQQKRLSLNKQILETSRNDELYITQKLNDDIRKIEENQAQLKIKEAENYYAIVSKNEKASKEEIITAQKEIALAKEEFNKTVFDNEVKRREESLRLYEATNKTVINKLFLQYAKGNAAVYDELFFKQEELRSKTLEAEIANLNKIREYIQQRGEDTTLVDEKITNKQKELVSEYFAFAQSLLQRYQDNVNNGVEKYNIALDKSSSNLSINKDLLQGQLDVLQQQVDLVEKVGDAREADLNYAKENTALKSKQQKLEKQIIKEQREALTQKIEAEKISLLIKQQIRDLELEILQIQQQQAEAEAAKEYKNAVAQNALAQQDPNLTPEEKQAEQLKEDKAKNNYEAQIKQGQLLQIRKRLNDNQTASENYGLALSARQQEDAIREREVANTARKSDDVRYAKERETRQQIQAPVLQGVSDININQTAVDTKITKAQQEASKNAKVIVAGYESSVNKLKDPIVKQQEQSNIWLEKIYNVVSNNKPVESIKQQSAQVVSNINNKQQVATNTTSLFQPKENTVRKALDSIIIDDNQQNITANNVKVYGKAQPKKKDTITLRNLNKDVELQEARKLAQQNAPSEAFIKRLQGSAYNINKQIDDIDDKLQQPGLSKTERDKLRKDKIRLKKDRDVNVTNRDKPQQVEQPKTPVAQPPKPPVAKKTTKTGSAKNQIVEQKPKPKEKQKVRVGVAKNQGVKSAPKQVAKPKQGTAKNQTGVKASKIVSKTDNKIKKVQQQQQPPVKKLVKRLGAKNNTTMIVEQVVQPKKAQNIVAKNVRKIDIQPQKQTQRKPTRNTNSKNQGTKSVVKPKQVVPSGAKNVRPNQIQPSKVTKPKQTKSSNTKNQVTKPKQKKPGFIQSIISFFNPNKPNGNRAKNNGVKAKPQPKKVVTGAKNTTPNKTQQVKPTKPQQRETNNLNDQIKQIDVRLSDTSLNAGTRKNLQQARKELVTKRDNIKQTTKPQQAKNNGVKPQQRKVTQPKQQPLPTNNFAKQRKIIEDRLAQQQKDKIAAQNKREQDRLKKLTPSERKLEETIKQVNPSFKQSDTGIYAAPKTQIQAFVPNVEKQQQKLTGIAKLRQERLARVEKRNSELNKPTTPQVADKSEGNNSNVVNSNNVAFSPQITINVNSEGKEIAKDVKEQLNDALFTLFNEVQRRQQA